jgi:hypothetical protein
MNSLERAVAVVVREEFGAVHAELLFVPAAGDVDGPAALGEPVDGGAPLGDGRREEEAGMDGGDELDALGGPAA